MDPNANLIEQEQIIDRLADYVVPQRQQEEQADRAVLRGLRLALRDWLRDGGFAPEWTKAPRAAKYYGR